MDSLTQIVLGAACGEVVLGRKIGNKALLFGAIGGTIPDLDVFIGRLIYTNEIDILAFHRAFMHSIVFAILASFLLGWLVYIIYNSRVRKQSTTLREWIWLFFLSIFTHPILDCFTPYGTQLFAPFSNYRVAFNTIAVVDPLYTLPFLVSLIVLMFYNRSDQKRRFWLRIAIGVSSVYMFLTIINKFYIDSIVKKSLQNSQIEFVRFQTQPTIFNNVLWYGIAETQNSYYVGFYSLFDSIPEINEWKRLPKNHDVIQKNDEINTLVWFSNEYYNYTPLKDGAFRYNDLRYPSFDKNDANKSVFSFIIKQQDDRWNAHPFEGKPPSSEEVKYFWIRLKGY